MWFISEGFKEAAEKFKIESGINPTIDLQTIDKRLEIRNCLQNGEIEKAVALINEIHPELLDNDNLLYFKIQVGIVTCPSKLFDVHTREFVYS